MLFEIFGSEGGEKLKIQLSQRTCIMGGNAVTVQRKDIFYMQFIQKSENCLSFLPAALCHINEIVACCHFSKRPSISKVVTLKEINAAESSFWKLPLYSSSVPLSAFKTDTSLKVEDFNRSAGGAMEEASVSYEIHPVSKS